ncbi:MAG TPA: hypothetical protein VHP35_17540, partial [Terriglobia bacterium]|nr:hypothetical protein [Terriglobia bacterium]
MNLPGVARLELETAPPSYLGTASSLLLRRGSLIAGFGFAGLVIAGLLITLMPPQYTAEAVLQARFSTSEPQSRSSSAASSISVGAGEVTETVAALIRSRAIAVRVAARLGLANDPAFAVRSPQPNSLSAESVIATKLMRKLDVSTDPKSYVIRVLYTSASPEQSALIANAFAEEYIRTRNEAAARRELGDLVAIYGPQHPASLRAQTKLDNALSVSNISDNAQIVMAADPPALPSGPSPIIILIVALLTSFGAGVGMIVLLEQVRSTFRTELELVAETNLPCLGLIPRSPNSRTTPLEAARILAATGDIGDPSADSKLLLLTSSLHGEGKSLLGAAIARLLHTMGRRTLTIDFSRGTGDTPDVESAPESLHLETFLHSSEANLLPLNADGKHSSTVLHSRFPPGEIQKVIASDDFSKFIRQARGLYDFIIVEAPPVMLFADALYLGKCADFILHVVQWASTPRRTVIAGLERMRNIGIRVDGLVLSGINEK